MAAVTAFELLAAVPRASYSSMANITLPGSLLQRTPSKMKNSGSGPKNAVSPMPEAFK